MKLSTAVQLFLSEWPAQAPAQGTIRAYARQLQWLLPFAQERGAELLLDLTPELLRAAVVAQLSERGPRPANFKGGEATAALLVAAARCMTRWLTQQGIPAPDLSTVKAPRVPERIQPRVTWQEFDRMERSILERLMGVGRHHVPRVAISRDLALLNVLAETGLRANETVHLTLRDIDSDNGLLTVRCGKGKKERTLSILGTATDADPRRVLRLLEEWVETRGRLRRATEHAYVWTSLKGNPLTVSELRLILGRICLEAGVRGTRPPHAFRRFQFTEPYREEPTALPRLSARMGWSARSHKMADVYTRGAQLDFARDRIPLMTNRRAPTRQPAEVDRAALVDAVLKDPELRRDVLQRLLGHADISAPEQGRRSATGLSSAR